MCSWRNEKQSSVFFLKKEEEEEEEEVHLWRVKQLPPSVTSGIKSEDEAQTFQCFNILEI